MSQQPIQIDPVTSTTDAMQLDDVHISKKPRIRRRRCCCCLDSILGKVLCGAGSCACCALSVLIFCVAYYFLVMDKPVEDVWVTWPTAPPMTPRPPFVPAPPSPAYPPALPDAVPQAPPPPPSSPLPAPPLPPHVPCGEPSTDNSTVTILLHVTGFKNAAGVAKMWVHLDSSSWYQGDDAWRIETMPIPSTNELFRYVRGVPSGSEVAVFLVHDKNNDGRLNTIPFIGYPREGVAASGGARGGPSGGPRFRDAVQTLEEGVGCVSWELEIWNP